jgi:hypothetical protein
MEKLWVMWPSKVEIVSVSSFYKPKMEMFITIGPGTPQRSRVCGRLAVPWARLNNLIMCLAKMAWLALYNRP